MAGEIEGLAGRVVSLRTARLATDPLKRTVFLQGTIYNRLLGASSITEVPLVGVLVGVNLQIEGLIPTNDGLVWHKVTREGLRTQAATGASGRWALVYPTPFLFFQRQVRILAYETYLYDYPAVEVFGGQFSHAGVGRYQYPDRIEPAPPTFVRGFTIP